MGHGMSATRQSELQNAEVELKYGADLQCPMLKFLPGIAGVEHHHLSPFQEALVRIAGSHGGKHEEEISERKKLSAQITMELRAGAHCLQGEPFHMEDRAVVCQFCEHSVFIGVFDGHAGKGCAEFAAAHLHKFVALSTYFENGDISAAVRAGIYDTNVAFLANADDGSGSTACVLVRHQAEMVWGNVGDSRLVLFSAGSAQQLSRDHKATDKAEHERLAQVGGQFEDGRVINTEGDCMLSCSRALGDGRFKDKLLVICEPEIGRREIQPGDEFAVVASDGVWDVLSNDAVCNIVKSFLGAEDEDVAQRAAAAVCEAALREGSRDNISAALLLL